MLTEDNVEDIKILKRLGYNQQQINSIVYTGAAYKAKSYPEQYLVEVLAYNYNKVISNRKMYNGMELDIAIYDINTGIEYCGYYFHKDIEARDNRKRSFLEKHGIRLVKIVEYSVNKIKDEKVNILDNDNIEIYRVGRSKRLEKLVGALSKVLNKELIIPDNIHTRVKERVYMSYKNQNLAYQYPDIAKEYSANNPIPPDKIFISDMDTVEWICSTCKNTFRTCTQHRVYNKTGCPYCNGNIATPGKTDILTILPGYASEITNLTEDEKRNTLPYSNRQVSWECTKCKYQWNSSIQQRTITKTGCPKCGYIPFKIDENNYISIDYLNNVVKPIESMVLNNVICKTTTVDAIGIIIEYLVKNNKVSLDNIMYMQELINKDNQMPKIYHDESMFNTAKLLTTINNINVYTEGKSSTKFKLSIINTLIKEFNLDIKFKIKSEYKLPKRITLNKNGTDFNVTIRLNKKIVYIGRRRSITEALKLRLSAEKYFLGDYQIQSDVDTIGIDNIPNFKELDEFKKF